MIDTGADISIIKENSDVFNDIQNNKIIDIRGIGEGVINSKGLVSIELQTDKYIIPYKFHLLNSDFAIPCDGIIGLDFIKTFNCKIDYNSLEDWFIIRPQNLTYPIYVPITFSSGTNSTLLPARSQVIRKIKLSSAEENILIPNQEIKPGVYVANTIATAQNTFVRFLNTTDKCQIVGINNIKFESLSNYDVVQNPKDNRKESVINKLKKNFPILFKKQLEEICTEYSDDLKPNQSQQTIFISKN